MKVRQFNHIKLCRYRIRSRSTCIVFYVLRKNELFVKVSAAAAHTNINHVYFNEGVLIIKSMTNIYIYTINKKKTVNCTFGLFHVAYTHHLSVNYN